MNNDYKTNPAAESILNSVIKILLILGIIISIGCLVGGLFLISDYEEEIGIPLLIGGVVFFILEFISWASMKVIINISRNLFNISRNTEGLNNAYSVLLDIQKEIQSLRASTNNE